MRIPPAGPERSARMFELATQIITLDNVGSTDDDFDGALEELALVAVELSIIVFAEHGDRSPSKPSVSAEEAAIAELWAKNPKLRSITEMYERLERDIRIRRSGP